MASDTDDATSDWRKHPARERLKLALAEGEFPADYKEFGPKQVWQKYKDDPAFAGLSYNPTFTRRLLALRKQALNDKEDADIDWKNCRAKQFLKQCFKDGMIPLQYSQPPNTGPQAIWNMHCKDHPAFAGMSYNETFTRRLRSVRDNHQKKNDRDG